MDGLNREKNILNVAAYRFFPLEDPLAIRFLLRDFCRQLGLKGTILLSHEGVNSFVAGSPEAIQSYKEYLHGSLGLPKMEYKESWSSEQPFTRMLVKIKKEIIRMGVDSVKPYEKTGAYIKPKDFKKLLDDKKELLVLDTRNEFEIKLGKFRSAIDLKLNSFSEFPEKTKLLEHEDKKKPVVMYCTGGIRCEKASVYLEQQGFEAVYQLDGGILKYFEECGSEYFDGECFVFDKRIGLDEGLKETKSTQCYNCRHVLLPDELSHPNYQPPHTCPHCHPSC